MKKVFFAVMISVMGIVGFVAFKLLSESERRISPKAFANFKSENLRLEVDYSSPFKKGRVIFGGLVEFGKYWRTGADEATEITFKNDVLFGGEEVSAGRYRLYTIPGKDSWQIVLNSELDQWGAFEPDYEQDVLRLDAKPDSLKKTEEQLIIDFEPTESGAALMIKWERTAVSVPIR